jgi:tetratricopeptide (TPR) repeat protein
MRPIENDLPNEHSIIDAVRSGFQLYENEDYTGLIKLISREKFTEKTNEESFLFFFLAESYFNFKEYDKAIEYYKGLLNIGPCFIEMYDRKKWCIISHYIALGLLEFISVEKALEQLNSCNEIHTKYEITAEIRNNTGQTFAVSINDNNDEPKKVSLKVSLSRCIKQIRDEIAGGAFDAAKYQRLGMFLEYEFNFKEAAYCYEKAISLSINDEYKTMVMLCRAIAIMNDGNYLSALKQYEDLFSLCSKYLSEDSLIEYLVNYGECCLRCGYYEKGIEVVTNIKNHTSGTYSLLARLCMSAGKIKHGIQWEHVPDLVET